MSKTTEFSTREELFTYGSRLQTRSIDTLKKSLSTVHDTIEIGKEIVPKLQQQKEQIKHIAGDLNDTNEEVLRADAIVQRMYRHEKCCILM